MSDRANRSYRFLCAVQAVLKSHGHSIAMDQHELQLVLSGLWSDFTAVNVARDVIADRGIGAV